MKKLILASVLALGLSTTANAGGLGGILKDAGDFFSGKNQYHNISENELVNTQWDKLKETSDETIYVRKADKDNGFSDGVWLKHVQKDGGSDEYKHYQTDCNSEGDVLRNAKITVRKTDGTLDRKKKDKIIKGDLKQDVRNLVCSTSPNGSDNLAVASESVAEKIPKLVVGPLPKKLNESRDLCTFLLKATPEDEIEAVDDGCAYGAEEVIYRADDPKKRSILKEDIVCKWTQNDVKQRKKGKEVNIPCQDALNLNGKTVYLTDLYKKENNTDTFQDKDNPEVYYKVKVYDYQGYRITILIRMGIDNPEKGPPYLSPGVMFIEKGDYKESIKIIWKTVV